MAGVGFVAGLRSALREHLEDSCKCADNLIFRPGLLPFIAYHDVLIIMLAISIVLFCEYACPYKYDERLSQKDRGENRKQRPKDECKRLV